MNIIEIVVTVCSTVAGSVTIAFTTFYLRERSKKRTLFRALYDEIKLNIQVAQRQTKKPNLVFELSPLYTLSYQNIRTTGELLSLPEGTRRELEEVYEMIYAHNRQLPAASEFLPRDRGLYERAEKIVEKLKTLENELPKNLKFLG